MDINIPIHIYIYKYIYIHTDIYTYIYIYRYLYIYICIYYSDIYKVISIYERILRSWYGNHALWDPSSFGAWIHRDGINIDLLCMYIYIYVYGWWSGTF